jgi:hypothetical protein
VDPYVVGRPTTDRVGAFIGAVTVELGRAFDRRVGEKVGDCIPSATRTHLAIGVWTNKAETS